MLLSSELSKHIVGDIREEDAFITGVSKVEPRNGWCQVSAQCLLMPEIQLGLF